MSKKACWIILAYNEAASIGPVLDRVIKVRFPNVELVPVVINDGSKDSTESVAKSREITVISHASNKGVGAAFRTGLFWARDNNFDYLIQMDGDGQLSPEEVGLLLDPVVNGRCDIAFGSRFKGPTPANLPRWKSSALKYCSRFVGWLIGHKIFDISCGFRCMNRETTAILHPTFDYDYAQEVLIQAATAHKRILEIPITVLYPKKDEQKDSMSSLALRYSFWFLYILAFALTQMYWAKLSSHWKNKIGIIYE